MERRYNMKIKLKRGLSSNITAVNLDQGEPAFCTDTGKLYVGDGTQNILINPDGGIATEAGKLSVARKISLSGDASGNVSFDGSADVTLSVTVADDSHNHIISNIDGLQSALDGKVGNSRVLTDVPLNAKFTDTVTTINGKTGDISKADIVALGIPAQDTVYTHPTTHSISEVSGLQAALDSKQASLGFTPLNANLKGAVNGVAELDATGKVPASQLPSYVDDVLEYDNQAGFPTTGETGKIYIAKDTNKTYRWSGSDYVEISASLALGTTSSTAFRGDYGQIAYTHSQSAHAPSDAQKNSDITKAEIEAKLTGTITTHSHTVTKEDVGLGNVTNESKATMFTSPTFTGTPQTTTAAKGTNTTQIASTAYVMTALGDYVKTTDTIDGGTF